MSRGAIYVAFGEEFIDEAAVSAASLKSHMPGMPITLFSDKEVDSPYFDDVVSMPEPEFIYLDRIRFLKTFPFDHNLFLDSDTYICNGVSELFTLLEKFDIAAAHAPWRTVYRVDGVPDSFPEYNCGVILFKRSSRVRSFFETWLSFYQRDLEIYTGKGGRRKDLDWVIPNRANDAAFGFHDQASFREALYHSSLRLATLTPEYNCRSNILGYLHETVKILHGRHSDLEAAANVINAATEPRVHRMNENRDLPKIARWSSRLSIWKRSILRMERALERRGIGGAIAAGIERLFIPAKD